MKKFFIITNIAGEIISGDNEFVDEREAVEWAKAEGITDRCFIDPVTEIM